MTKKCGALQKRALRTRNKKMIIREVLEEEKKEFNKLAPYPVQSWEWGEFRQKSGLKVYRLGLFEDKRLLMGQQLTVHPIKKGYSILMCSRGPMPNQMFLDSFQKIAKEENSILVKIEPQVGKVYKELQDTGFESIKEFFLNHGCKIGSPFFPKWTFYLNLKSSEDEIMANMHPKTRYNVRLAEKHGITVKEENSQESFQDFLNLHFETTKRQGFFAHTPKYYQQMWNILSPAGIAHLMVARLDKKPLAAWLLFVFNNVLYYPYGGSSRENKEMMPNYLMMWETIKFGKRMGCENFDLWGAPGPNPKENDPWYGFYRFKFGFNPELIEFVGTYDLITNQYLYPLYNIAQKARWQALKTKSKISSFLNQ